MIGREILIYLAIKYAGDWEKIYNAINIKEKVDEKVALEKIAGVNAVTMLDEEYPNELKTIQKPPFVLFYKGDVKILKQHFDNHLAIIGDRTSSDKIRKKIHTLVDGMPKNSFVITGCGNGIAADVMNIAAGTRPVIAVLGSALNKKYPSLLSPAIDGVVSNGGLIVSEYPDDVEVTPEHLMKSKRIIAGLSGKIAVMKMDEKSGSYITVIHALQQGKDVYALPSGEFTTKPKAIDRLIEEGAIPLITPDTINWSD